MLAYTLNVDKEMIEEIKLGHVANLEQCEIDLDEIYDYWSWDKLDIEIELSFVKQLSLSQVNGFLS
ncbi:MAG: hypothetical protein Q9M39_03765 [Sulfurovum sp.]|nr:hypothetical protein [Sulfurovum sp.]